MPQRFFLTRAKFLCDQDRKPLRKALNHAKRQPVQPVDCTKSCQRFHPEYLSNDCSIYDRVKLLKNISCHQWQRKQEEQPHRASLRQILCMVFQCIFFLFHSLTLRISSSTRFAHTAISSLVIRCSSTSFARRSG